jgi:hypothetical protein
MLPSMLHPGHSRSFCIVALLVHVARAARTSD